MNNRRRIACVALILELILVLLLHRSSAFATELNGKEKTLAFLSDVAMLDLSKYTITLRDYEVTYPSEYSGVPKEDVRYILTTASSKLDATVVYVNGTYSYCLLGWLSGGPIYKAYQLPDLIDSTKDTIARYEAYIGSSRFQEMQMMLNYVDKVENTAVTQGNIKLKVSVESRSTGFQWVFKGVETSLLTITFWDGALYGLGDHLSIFKIGGTEAKVTAEEAINIAVTRARSFSWTVNGVVVSGFSILREHSTALLTMNVREQPLTLYPLWRVDLPLDKTYAGGVSAIAVGVWADTGEVSYIQELSYGGALQDSNATLTEPSDSPSQTPGSATPDASAPDSSTPNQTPSEQTPDTSAGNIPDNSIPIVAAGLAVAITATAAAAIYVKKKRK